MAANSLAWFALASLGCGSADPASNLSDSASEGTNDEAQSGSCTEADAADVCVCDDQLDQPPIVWGMAETGAGTSGWYGEDCLPGDDRSPGYDVCHDAWPAVDRLRCLQHVADPDSVAANLTTLLSDALPQAANITYYMATGGTCYVWGNDPAYYSGLGCEVQ